MKCNVYSLRASGQIQEERNKGGGAVTESSQMFIQIQILIWMYLFENQFCIDSHVSIHLVRRGPGDTRCSLCF